MRLRTALVSLSVGLALCLSADPARAVVTPYSWIRGGEAGGVFADSSGTGHPFNAGFSEECDAGAGGTGDPAAVIVPTGVGGPLGGTGGAISTACTRWGYYHCRASGIWIQGPAGLPTPEQWSLPAVDWVMECWVLPQGTGGSASQTDAQIISTGSEQFAGTAGGARLVTHDNADGTITIRATRIGPGEENIGNPVLVDTAHWNHLAVVNDSGVTTFYVNGVPNGEPRTDVSLPSGVPYIGSGEGSLLPFDGYLDEVRYSTFAPGAFQVSDLLTRAAGPNIIVPPESSVVWSGGPALFQVQTAIDPDLTYQWKRDGTDLPGQTAAELFLPAVAAGDDGALFTVVLNSSGVALTSSSATLAVASYQAGHVEWYRSAVQSEPSLVAYIPVDGSSGFSVANVADVTRAGALSFEAGYDGRTNRAFGERALRFKGDNDVAIPNSPAYEFSDGSGTIEAIVYLAGGPGVGTVGTVFSLATDLSSTYYAIQASYDGSTLIYRSDQQTPLTWQLPRPLLGRRAHIAMVFAAGNVTAYLDGESLGAKASEGFGFWTGLNANIGSSGRDFNAAVQDPWVGAVDELAIYGNALSASTITIHNSRYLHGMAVPPPVITSSPSGSKSLLAGGELFFRVTASGAAPLSYQWKLNGTPITGNPSATTPNLRIPSSTLAMSGGYTVTVANQSGSATSDPFTLSFTAPPDSYSATVMADAPSAYWRLNETAGTTLQDLAGGHDGTYASTVDRGMPGVSGLGDGAAHFAGTGDPIPNAVVPYTPTLNPTTPFSIEFWAKPDRDGRQDIAVLSSQDRNSGRAGYAIYQGLNGAVWEAHIGFQNSVLFVSGMTSPEAGRWDHVVVTWDGVDTTRIYVNGTDETDPASDVNGPNRPNLEVPLEIGSRFGGGVPYAGTIDEVAFYNRALTPAQIQQHWSMSWLAPWITQQPPATLAGFEPDPAIITAAAAGYPNTYQWFKDGQPLTPETNPDGSQHYQGTNSTVLTITQSTPKDNGRYHLEVFNPLGNTASTPTVLTVRPDLSQPKVVHVTADSSMFRVRVTFDRWVTPETASVFDNYTFTGGVTANSVALTFDPAVVDVLTTPLAPGGHYTLSVSGVKDQRLSHNLVAPNNTPFRGYLPTAGMVAWDFYPHLDASGGNSGSLDRFMNDPYYPNGVYTNGVLTTFSTMALTGGDLNTQPGFTGGLGENYGMRVYGWVTPKVSGNYTFFLRSDEASELWLSPDADPANLRKALIAYETGCCEPFKEPDPGNVFTTSEPRNLTAGRSYFIEAFLSEGAGGDYVEVAWRREGDTTPAANLMPIQGTFLSAYAPVPALTAVLSGGQVTISWLGGGILQESYNSWNWTPVPGNPTSPYTVTPGTAKFYRVAR